jgi:hypothetical protein
MTKLFSWTRRLALAAGLALLTGCTVQAALMGTQLAAAFGAPVVRSVGLLGSPQVATPTPRPPTPPTPESAAARAACERHCYELGAAVNPDSCVDTCRILEESR